MRQCDVLINGGGLIGLSAAMMIHHFLPPLNIILLEKKTFQNNPSENARALVINSVNLSFLNQVPSMQSFFNRAYSINSIKINHHKAFGSLVLKAQDLAMNHLGKVVNADFYQMQLKNFVLSQQNIALLEGHCIESIDYSNKNYCLKLNNGQLIQTPIILAADGVNSLLAQYLSISYKQIPYEQHALTWKVHCSKPNHGQAFEYFLNKMTLALIPIDTHIFKCVCSQNSENEHIYQQLNQYLGFRFGHLKNISAIRRYDLYGSKINEVAKQGVYFIGNAANTLHPIGAQGYNLGLRDIGHFIDILHGQIKHNAETLYQEKRAVDHAFAMRLVGTLALNPQAVWLGRWLCLISSRLKRKAIEYGLGLNTSLPECYLKGFVNEENQ